MLIVDSTANSSLAFWNFLEFFLNTFHLLLVDFADAGPAYTSGWLSWCACVRCPDRRLRWELLLVLWKVRPHQQILLSNLPGSSFQFFIDAAVFPREHLVRCLVLCWTPWALSLSCTGFVVTFQKLRWLGICRIQWEQPPLRYTWWIWVSISRYEETTTTSGWIWFFFSC